MFQTNYNIYIVKNTVSVKFNISYLEYQYF